MNADPLSVLRAAADEPARTAMVVDGRTVSFGELAGDVRTAIAGLRRQGIAPGTARVGLVGEDRYPNVVLFHALVELGVAALLVHPRSPAAERRRELAETATERLLDGTELIDEPAADGASPGGLPAHDPEQPLAIVRTSGTSGRPKWVVLSRRAFAAAAAASARNLGWQDDDRWLLSLPIAHVGGLSIVTRCLLGRRAVVIETLPRFDARAVADTVDRRRVTLLSLVPTMLHRLLDLPGWRPPARVRAMLVGGAAAARDLLAAAAARGWPILTTYGLTEACSQVATQPYAARGRGLPGCGPPVHGMEVRVRDGVLELRGPSLLSGYLTAPSAALTRDGWFRTGDLGELDRRGHLHVLGRRDEVLVSGGENVHPAEVEEALAAHPAILESCAFGVADPEWGQRLAVAVVARGHVDAADLEAFLTSRLAPHKRPRQWAILTELPRTASGKLDRARAAHLAEPLLEPLR